MVVERPVQPPEPDPDLLAIRAEGTPDDPFRSLEQAELSTTARRWLATVERHAARFDDQPPRTFRPTLGVSDVVAADPGTDGDAESASAWVEHGEQIAFFRAGTLSQTQPLPRAYAAARDGQLAFLTAEGLEMARGAFEPRVLPTAHDVDPVWNTSGETLFFVRAPTLREVGFDEDGGPPRVYSVAAAGGPSQLVFDQTRIGDRVTLYAASDPWIVAAVTRGRTMEVWRVDGRQSTRADAPLNDALVATVSSDALVVAQERRVTIIDGGVARTASVARAHLADAWQNAEVGHPSRACRLGDAILLAYDEGPISTMRTLDSGALHPVRMEPGVVDALAGDAMGAWVLWSNPSTPPRLLRLSASGTTRVMFEDGPRVPGVRFEAAGEHAYVADGGGHERATVVEAMGAFGRTARARYRPEVAAWLAAGGRWVFADVPGGAPRRSEWHLEGTAAGKLRSAERLRRIAEAVAPRSALVFFGWSHGGVLAALAGSRGHAVVLRDPVADLSRGPLLGDGLGWREEYGAEPSGWSPYARALDTSSPTPSRVLVQLDPAAAAAPDPPAHGLKLAAAWMFRDVDVVLDRSGAQSADARLVQWLLSLEPRAN